MTDRARGAGGRRVKAGERTAVPLARVKNHSFSGLLRQPGGFEGALLASVDEGEAQPLIREAELLPAVTLALVLCGRHLCIDHRDVAASQWILWVVPAKRRTIGWRSVRFRAGVVKVSG